MATTPKCIIPSQQLTDSNSTYYTATNVRTIIDQFTVCNTTAGAVLVTVDLVDSGGTAGVSERIISGRSISAGETYNCPEIVGHYIESGGSVQMFASAAASLTVRASGREVSGI